MSSSTCYHTVVSSLLEVSLCVLLKAGRFHCMVAWSKKTKFLLLYRAPLMVPIAD